MTKLLDDILPIPDYKELNEKYNFKTKAYFKKDTLNIFEHLILNIKNEIKKKNDNWEVEEENLILEDENDIIYQDKYQVLIKVY